MNWVVVFTVLTILLFVVLLIPFTIEKITENRFNSMRKKIELIKEIIPSVSISKISYPIYYINMDKHTERRTHMETQLTKFSDDFHRIRGFNGYEIKNKKTDTVDGITFVNSYESLSKAEIGCTMSHLIAIKTAKDSGTDTALICEDDVLFDTYALFGKTLEEIVQNSPKDWEILQLVAIHPKLEHWYSDIEDISDLRYIRREYPGKAFWSCAVYLINKNGMDKVSKVITDKYLLSPTFGDFPKEGVADTFIFDLANTYAVLPCPFIINNTELESTIHPDHTPLHIQSSLILLSKFNSKLLLWGFPRIARFCSEIRRLNPFKKASFDSKIWKVYVDHILPCIFVICHTLKKLYTDTGADGIAFLSRDMYITWKIFSALYPSIKSKYVFFSRRAVEKGSKEFLDYFKSQVNSKTIVVDLYGTGSTMKNFQEKNSLDIFLYVMCHHSGSKRQYEKTINLTDYSPPFIERMNYSIHGSFADIVNGVPVGYRMEYSPKDIQGYTTLVDTVCKMLQNLEYDLEEKDIDTDKFLTDFLSVSKDEYNTMMSIPHEENHNGTFTTSLLFL